MKRGEIWWASLPDPAGSGPGYRRPVLIIQEDAFNESNIDTVIVVVITRNLRLAEAPGNILLPRKATKLPHASVANVSQVFTIDKKFLTEKVSTLAPFYRTKIDDGLKLVLSL